MWSVGVDLERNQLRVHGSGFVLGLTWRDGQPFYRLKFNTVVEK